uniref:Conserved secreted protein n=1 Tax=Macrostomum lignano TaxID=282301 RepID=A0A1I8G568_9PLAT
MNFQRFFLSVGLLVSALQIEAANHYCVNQLMLKISLDDFYHRDEILIPQLPHETEVSEVRHRRCRWIVSFNTGSKCTQLVLVGLPARKNSSFSSTDSRLRFTSMSNAKTTVLPGIFHVVPLESNKIFLVEASWDPRTDGHNAANLRFLLPLPSICSRDMLSYRNSCFAVDSLQQSLTDALSSIRGDAQLASFTSWSEIEEFIASNEARAHKFPYRQPLILDQPVRLGMFRNASNDGLLSIARTPSGCELQPASVKIADAFGGDCVSLTVDSNGPVIAFVNCNIPMLSLVSFPETHSGLSQLDCNLPGRLSDLFSANEAVNQAISDALMKLQSDEEEQTR